MGYERILLTLVPLLQNSLQDLKGGYPLTLIGRLLLQKRRMKEVWRDLATMLQSSPDSFCKETWKLCYQLGFAPPCTQNVPLCIVNNLKSMRCDLLMKQSNCQTTKLN